MKRAAGALVLAAAAAAGVAVPLLVLDDSGPRLTKSRYEQRVTEVYRALGESFRGLEATGRPAETSRDLRAMKVALDRAAAALERLRPPRAVEGEHRALVEATRDYAAQVDLVRASVDFGDPVTIASHLREVTAPAGIRRALRGLAAKGYRIPVTVIALR